MYVGTAQIESSQADHPSTDSWSKAMDRVDVYPSKDGYTATILRHDEVGDPTLISMRSGRPRTWRDLDNLVAYVLRNVTNQPSIHVHIGVKQ
ncbi:hypothetical protein [Xanthomonas arboricola]|uniref:hypothetical protein n=1 Tax=Xanthomonas arboricola TaxID=56448 RepID=UPI0011B050FF|nr:hypothetical protein [Xanthomonas arboricola]